VVGFSKGVSKPGKLLFEIKIVRDGWKRGLLLIPNRK